MMNSSSRLRATASLLLLVLGVGASVAFATPLAEDAAQFRARIEAPQPTQKPQSPQKAQSPQQAELDALSIPELLKKQQVPGVSIAVIHDFKLHWAAAYGVADAATARPVNRETRFQAASISKPLTAVAALRLAQDGKLDLDADINRYLKSWQVPTQAAHAPVTARSLLSHTSGANDCFGFPGYLPGTALPSPQQILNGEAPSNVGKVEFTRTPYAAWKYSGGGYMLMQLAISEISGQAFAEHLRARVLAPLAMKNSRFETPSVSTDQNTLALAHDDKGQRMEAPWHVYPETATSALWTTPSDLAKFMIALQVANRDGGSKFLSRTSIKDMLSPVGVGRFGVGLGIDQRGAGWYFNHGGSNWGYRAFFLGHFRKGYGFVIMTNSDNGMAVINAIADRISDTYAWDAPEA